MPFLSLSSLFPFPFLSLPSFSLTHSLTVFSFTTNSSLLHLLLSLFVTDHFSILLFFVVILLLLLTLPPSSSDHSFLLLHFLLLLLPLPHPNLFSYLTLASSYSSSVFVTRAFIPPSYSLFLFTASPSPPTSSLSFFLCPLPHFPPPTSLPPHYFSPLLSPPPLSS